MFGLFIKVNELHNESWRLLSNLNWHGLEEVAFWGSTA